MSGRLKGQDLSKQEQDIWNECKIVQDMHHTPAKARLAPQNVNGTVMRARTSVGGIVRDYGGSKGEHGSQKCAR